MSAVKTIKKIPRTTRSVNKTDNKPHICPMCLETYKGYVGNFYKNRASALYEKNETYVFICNKCVQSLYKRDLDHGTKFAAIMACARLDLPFIGSVYQSVEDSKDGFRIGVYIARLNPIQFRTMTFADSILNGEVGKDDFIVREEMAQKWDFEDTKNRDRVIKIMRYDPFTDFTEIDRKYMFNMCSDYMIDESITEDVHKLHGVLEIVKTQQQLLKIDSAINLAISDTVLDPVQIKSLTDTKSKLMTVINSFAKENGISVATSEKNKRKEGSLAWQLKQLETLNYTDSEANLFDINTSRAFEQIAEVSNRSILRTLNFSEADWNTVLVEQTEELQKSKKKIAALEEELRLYKLGVYNAHKKIYSTLEDEITQWKDGVIKNATDTFTPQTLSDFKRASQARKSLLQDKFEDDIRVDPFQFESEILIKEKAEKKALRAKKSGKTAKIKYDKIPDDKQDMGGDL